MRRILVGTALVLGCFAVAPFYIWYLNLGGLYALVRGRKAIPGVSPEAREGFA